MNLEKLPKQYQLFYTISRKLFLEKEFKCVAILSKNPYLTALIACHGAKVDISPPYLSGTCILLPEKDKSKGYFHAVIDETVVFEGGEFYYFRRRKPRANSICEPERHASKCSEIESEGKVFPYQVEKDWLGKRNIVEEDLKNLSNSLFPVIVGRDAKSKVNYWKNMPLGIDLYPNFSMQCALNSSIKNSNISALDIYTSQSFNGSNYPNQIWVNEVPENIDKGRFLIIISPFNSNFKDLIMQVDDLYSEKNLVYVDFDNVSEELKRLGFNKTILTATIMKEAVK